MRGLNRGNNNSVVELKFNLVPSASFRYKRTRLTEGEILQTYMHGIKIVKNFKDFPQP